MLWHGLKLKREKEKLKPKILTVQKMMTDSKDRELEAQSTVIHSTVSIHPKIPETKMETTTKMTQC